MSKRLTWICNYCGSDSVSSDASASWNNDKQDWEIDSVQDYEWCSNCEGESRLTELYATDEYPPGTEKAVMVKELSGDGGETNNFTIITDETDQEYAVEFSSDDTTPANQVFSEKSIYILKKRDEFHWEYEA